MSYVDTSVVAAYYCPERLSQKAENALRTAGAPVISSLVEVELASAVARKVRTKELDRVDGARVLAEFRSHIAGGYYDVRTLNADHYEKAFEWVASMSVPLRTLDALHLAIASELGEQLVTADTQMASASKTLRVKCKLLR